ncbi:MAG TPA: 2-(1,2-epoxy-1,2-dihydrophenyl)acetyl-CoA isomerase [Candidatus Thioglobus sp.]|nr:2-(1,2-epoxy-1,2-dihydrophenyl)acetyl-CoA isomerase [Candidatus Thioglobus sp.]
MKDHEKTILLEVTDGLAILTLNRPEKLNSLNKAMFRDFKSALKKISPDQGVRCLIITGAGKGFCAGQDLNERSDLKGNVPDLSASLEKNYNPIIRKITQLEVPVLCAVNGVAAGAGSSIALACDIVFAARSASFIQAFCKIGLIPDSGGTWLLPHKVGRARALGLSLLGDKLSAEKAEEWGLIWKCMDDDKLLEEVLTIGKQLATQPTKGLSLIKRAIGGSFTNSLSEQLDLERDLQGVAGETSDYQEGVAAFLDKRSPTFTGN